MTESKAGPLDGVRVLDLTRVVAGPYCSMFLGDLGAEVVKVEQPGVGDDTRGWGPPFTGGESAYYLCINRNKQSLTLDLKSPRAVELLRELAKHADVLLENFRPGTMERLGLGEKELRALNPRLIYASLTGFGADGPMSDWPGYDLIVQAWGGLMSITGTPDGEPVKVGVAIIDLVAGLMLGKAITAALFAREKIGVGQRIDTSLLEAEVASLINVGSNYLIGGKIPTRWGNAHPNIVPYQNFKTADGYLVIGVASETIWKRFCAGMGRTDLAQDPRFGNNSKRVENRAELIEILSKMFLERDNDTWFKLLTEAEVPCAPVQTVDQVFQAPQVLHRDMLLEIDHPTAGKVRMAGIPVKFSETPASVRKPPPLLGEHNEEVLKNWLGMGAAAIAELKKREDHMTGKTFEEFHAGDRYSTGRRTITEHDILQFVNLVGLTEPLFQDMEYIRNESLYGERIAPGSLTFGMAEGLTVQTGLIHGTGMAFAGLDKMRLFAPVKVNDTINVEIEVLDTKPIPARGGGIVRYRQWVKNQRGETIMEYDVARLIRGQTAEKPSGVKGKG